MTRRRSIIGLLALAFAGVVTALDGTAPALAQEKVLRVRIGSDMTALDPAKLFNIENQTVSNHIFNGLVRYEYEKSGGIVPDLAEKWELSADGKTYTFHLRKGVKWHRGHGELTADDVKFSYDRVLDPQTASRYKGEFKLVEAIEVVDPLTVRIRLKAKYPGFLNKVAAYNQGFVVSRKAMEKLGDRYATEPIGTGPFVFESWSPKNQVVLVANKEYFLGAPKLDRIIFRVIQEETTAEIALQRGEIDVFYALQNAEVIARLAKVPGITVHRRTANHTINMILNSTYEPLGKPLVRRAIAHALNLKAMRDVFFSGLKGQPNWVLTASFPEAAKDLTEWPYDPEKAKTLLREAGYPSGFKITVTSFTLQPYDKIAVLLADDLRKVGIDASVQILERAAYLAARGAGTPHVVLTGVTGPADPDQPLWNLLHSSSFPPGLNTARYAGIDELLEAAQVELDRGKRLAIYRQIQQKLREDVPVVPLYNDVLFAASRAGVKNFAPDPQFTMNASGVTIDK
ncbi:MAG: ABC transporter substrate-binding protein [Candidatus Rokuibacteriota bacterium]|jgi:peptide/nickel transport system substrate-binding protein